MLIQNYVLGETKSTEMKKKKKANDMQLLSFFRGHVTHLLL